MQEEKSHIQQVIDAVFDKIHSDYKDSDENSVPGQGEKKNLEDALAAEKNALAPEKKALEKKKETAAEQTSETAVSGGWLSNVVRGATNALKGATELVSSATQETPYSITLLTALITHLNSALEKTVQNATQSEFLDTTWYLLKYLQHPINNPGQARTVVQAANERRKTLSTTLSETYKTQANEAKEAHERQHQDKTSRLAKFKARLNPQEKEEEEKKVLSRRVQKLRAEGNAEQQAIIDSYHTLKTMHEAKDTFYQAAELKESGIALQKQYLEQELGMNGSQNQFLEEKDTEKMERRVDALAELTRDQKQASSQGKSFTFYALIRDTRQKNPLISNPSDRPQPAKQDKARANAALQNYLVIKALGSLQATHFRDTETLHSIALFLMQTTLLAQNTALPTSFTRFKDTLKQQADTFLATAKAEVEVEVEAKQASPALTERQTALRLQLAQMAVAHHCGAEENQASTAFQIQSEKKGEYFTRKIKPAMDKVVNLNENELSFWLAFFPDGEIPNVYSTAIQIPENASTNALFYALAPKKYTENEVREREEKATEAAKERVETLEQELKSVKDTLTAEKDNNRQLAPLREALNQALAEAKTAQAEAKTAQADAKTAQEALETAQAEAKTAQDALNEVREREEKATEAAKERVETLQTQLTQAREDAKTARARLSQTQVELVAQKGLNGQLEPLRETLRTQTQQLTQAQADAKTARAEAETARADAKAAQDALQTQLTQAQEALETARAEAAQGLQAQLTQAQEEAKTAQAPSAKPHFAAQLVGAMGATIAYLVLSPEKGEMPPSLQLGIIAASFLAASSLAFTLINVFVYRCRANNHGSQVAPGQGGS